MENDLRNNINKLKEYFFKDDNLLKIKNKCFNYDNIKLIEKRLQEKESELKNMKFICHELKDDHLREIVEILDISIDKISSYLEKLGLEKDKIKKISNFKYIKSCCENYNEIKEKLLYLQNAIAGIENEIIIKEDLNVKDFNSRFYVGIYKELTLEMAKEKKEHYSKMLDKINSDISNGLKTFHDEQKEKKILFETGKKDLEKRIEKMEDSLFCDANKAIGNSIYNDLKFEIIDLELHLLKAN